MLLIDQLRSRTTERPTSLEGIFLTRYQFASCFIKDKKVLDIGTGLGEGAYYLAQKGAKKVVGIDYSKIAITEARKKFTWPNLEFRVMDALEILSLNERFDVITAFEIIEHLPAGTYSTFIAQIKAVLHPRGICLISTPNKLVSSPNRLKPKNPYHTKEFTPEELAELTKKHFANTTLLGIGCVNKEFLEKSKLIKRRWGNRLASFFSRYKLVRELLPLIPDQLKKRLTAEDLLPTLKASDFRISSRKVNQGEGLLAVCVKDVTNET